MLACIDIYTPNHAHTQQVPNPGRLRAVGSSLFLKGHYGVGYSLTIVKAEQTAPSQPIVALVQSFVPDAEVTSEAGAELAFRLPFAASPAFPPLFRSLDRGMATGELRVSTYGIAVTTLLEVFLRIGEESAAAGVAAAAARHGGSDAAAAAAIEDEKEKVKAAAVLPPLEAEGATTRTSSSSYKSATFSRHVGALVRKRYLYAVRDRKSQCCQLVLPALLVLLGLSLVKLLGNPLVQDELLLTPAMFNPDHGPRERNPLPVLATTPTAREVMARLSVDDEGGKGLLASYVDVATVDGGGGTTCLRAARWGPRSCCGCPTTWPQRPATRGASSSRVGVGSPRGTGR